MKAWYASNNPNGFVTGKRFSIDEPCVTVMARGMGGDWLSHWYIHMEQGNSRKIFHENGGFSRTECTDKPSPTIMATQCRMILEMTADSRQQTGKPPYNVPSMEEINAIPWNGFKVASTFSGCGGSCLGYRMAGFRVVWANEFVPAAQDSYRANMKADCHLDCRDIKLVQPADILDATGLSVGELDLFDGSPPCQAFSTAGKREKGWGHKKTYEHGASQCNETLFDHYIRLLRGLKPKVFVAENVSGLVKGTCKGYFLEILAAMKASGYRVTCRVCDAQWLGVPQMRQRTIFIGVREDIGLDPVHPKPLAYRYSVRDALPWISEVSGNASFKPIMKSAASAAICASGASENQSGYCKARVIHDTSEQWAKNVDVTDKPCPAITIGVNSVNSNHFKVDTETVKRKFTIAELKRICAFPDDFVLTGSYAQQWERLGNSVPPVMMYHIAECIKVNILQRWADHTGKTPKLIQ